MAVESPVEDKTEQDGIGRYTMQELETIMQTESDPLHVEFRDEFLNNETAFLEKHVKNESSESPQENNSEIKDETKEESKESSKDESKDDKNLLHTYKNVEAMSKGITEKDNYIKLLENSTRQDLGLLKDDNVSLKRQILDLQKKKEEKPSDVKDVKVPDLDTDDDMFDEKYQKGMRESMISVVEENKSLKTRLDTLESGVQATQQEAETRKVNRQREDELQEVDIVRKEADDIFKSKRPLKDIETDYTTFIENIKMVAGVSSEPTRNPNGTYTDTVNKLYNDYMENKEFTQKCKDNSVTLPEDFNDFIVASELRQLRNRFQEQDATGKYKPISYREAVLHYRAKNTDINKVKMDSRIEGRKSYDKAVENRDSFAKETSSKDGGNPVDLTNIPITDFNKLIEKGKGRTETESDLLKSIMKKASFSEKEINDLMN